MKRTAFVLICAAVWAAWSFAPSRAAGQAQDPDIAKYIKQLEHSNKHARRRAAEALAAKGAAASEAVTALVKASMDKEADVRLAVVRALAEVDPTGKEAIPILIQKLKDNDAAVAAAAANALAKIGAPAVPELIKSLSDENQAARLFAAGALGNIGKEAEDAVEALTKILENKKENRLVQMAAYSALMKIGLSSAGGYTRGEFNKASGSRRLLIQLESGSSPGSCMLAALVFAKLGPAAKAAVPALTKATENENIMVALLAHYALAKITEDASEHIEQIVKALDDETTRRRAAWALGEIGPPAEAAVPRLQKASKSADPAFRDAASKAIKKITGK